MPTRYQCFEPIINEQTITLILGSLPSPLSLQHHQYYGNPNNKFWTIVYDLFAQTLPDLDYHARCQFLLHHGLGLWDVFSSAEREGAADAKIQNPKVNDFLTLFIEYPRIKRLVFNGATAETFFLHAYPGLGRELHCIRAMSTSPAYACKYEIKLENWRYALMINTEKDLPNSKV